MCYLGNWGPSQGLPNARVDQLQLYICLLPPFPSQAQKSQVPMHGSSSRGVWTLHTHVRVTSGSLGTLLRGLEAPVPLNLLLPLQKHGSVGASGASCFQLSPTLARAPCNYV